MFKNSILLIFLSDPKNIEIINVLKLIYNKYFKQIIFYGDYPIVEYENNEINFINIDNGFYIQKCFYHFYKKYNSLIDECDGIFFIKDGNIININILNFYKNNKIIFDNNFKDINDNNELEKFPANYSLKNNLKNLLNDNDFKKHNINTFNLNESVYFYLPKKYLTEELFNLFKIFYKYKIFYNVAIPTVINYIEKNTNNYHKFIKNTILNNETNSKEVIYNLLNKEHSLFINIIDILKSKYLKILKQIFCKDKCVIITTINKPTETILKHMKKINYDVIIVGDIKTPNDYKKLNCIYLDIKSQRKFFPDLCELIPYNHYCRKNLGYLYAIKKGYNLIYETDDDNIPYDNFDNVLNNNNYQMITENDNKWINIFKYFTNNKWIWPRGYPLSLIKKHHKPNYSFKKSNKKPSIINGLVHNDPDVDSIYRLTCNNEDDVKWEENKSVLINNKNICVFNTQNTFWLNTDLFISMLIPTTVSFRYCDILRGLISNVILNKTNNYMMYCSPNVIQKRNDHNLITDFKSEYEMFINNEIIGDLICNNIEPKLKFIYLIQAYGKLPDVYKNFRNNKKYLLLSYKENTEDTDIFFPNSTWTTGRNKIREYILNSGEEYDYYIFVDEDIVFVDRNQSFDDFEQLLNIYRPYVGNPYLIDYWEYNNIPNNSKAYPSVCFDGICNAYSLEALKCNYSFPFIKKFDNFSWWASQYMMIMKQSLLNNKIIVFKQLKIKNINHSNYPRCNFWPESEKYVSDNLIHLKQLNIIKNIQNTGINKIFDFLNILFNKYDYLNVIDIGCGKSTFRNLLKHKNIFSIGIDPLLNEYKNKFETLNYNNYDITYDLGIDIKENTNKNLNITKTLNKSSFYDFENASPNYEDITEIIQIKTNTLKNIIKKHLIHDLIHILIVDTSGNDLNVIKSGGDLIKNVMFIVMNSSFENTNLLYKNSTKFSEDYKYLEKNNFKLITKEIVKNNNYFCLYYNKNIIRDFKPYWRKEYNLELEISVEYIKELLKTIYEKLLDNKIIKEKDIDILNKWIKYF